MKGAKWTTFIFLFLFVAFKIIFQKFEISGIYLKIFFYHICIIYFLLKFKKSWKKLNAIFEVKNFCLKIITFCKKKWGKLKKFDQLSPRNLKFKKKINLFFFFSTICYLNYYTEK